MGESEDAKEYDQERIFTHLCVLSSLFRLLQLQLRITV